MQLVIERATGTVKINGTSHEVDCASLPPEIARVAWNDDHGTVTLTNGVTTGIGDTLRFKSLIDAWHDKQNALRTR